jgi:hypothetical protein
MAIDASIYGQIRQPEAFNPLAEMAQFQQLQAAQNQNKLAALGFQDRERAINDANTLRDAVRGFGQDTSANYQSLLKTGNLTAAQDYQKKIQDQQKTASEISAKDFETASKRLDVAGQAFGFVRANPTLENAVSTIGYLERNGILSPEQAKQYRQTVEASPQAIGQLAEQAFRSTLDAKDQLGQIKVTNLGGTSQTTSVDPVTSRVTVLADTPITQSADNAATQATARANNAATVGATIRGQDMTDSRGREANATQRELLIQERGLKVADLHDKADARARAKDAGAASIQNQIAVIDKALSHPGRKTATGLSGTLDPRNYVPGTDATDFRAVLDQIGGAAFLQAFESLKGGGAITEVEGKKATDAVARLNRAQSDAEFETALRDLRKVMSDGYERLGRGTAPGEAKPGAPAKTSSGATASNW